ncbi:MAG TPA: HAMP domain-containing sensor histidine kinase [Acidimicrobiales bacterium]|nr:HAMP domain-containing sensor histidine kinase [Acidimicrobiales bacterium]
MIKAPSRRAARSAGDRKRREVPRRGLAHAARVALVATLVVAVAYLSVVAVLEVLVTRRLTRQVDARLTERLRDRSTLNLVLSDAAATHVHDLDDAPVFVWAVDASGRTTARSPDAPALPEADWTHPGRFDASLGSSNFRFDVISVGRGYLVAGESLAERDHTRGVLIASAAVVGPLLLVAVYAGALLIARRAVAPVEEARRRQLEFTADASHELRTPLSVVEAEVGLTLGRQRTAEEYRAALERIGGESNRLRRIVEDLLWLARSDAEPARPADEPVDLAVLAEVCVGRFQAVASRRDLNLSVVDAGEPVWIKAPPEMVDRLLGVLVDNACRYSPPGGSVRVAVSTSGPLASVAVEDTGPGIAPDERDRLFDRFHRASDQPGGAGLGLAIADSVVRSTGGRWRIGRSPEGGARMEVQWHRAAPGR